MALSKKSRVAKTTKTAHAALFASLVFQLSGCAAIASEPVRPAAAKNALVDQLIIKFKPQTLSCSAAGIAQLASATRTRLDYVRSMSGDTCVIRQIGDKAAIVQGEQRIRQHPATQWLEPDARMKAF
jgi:hypothetical protein